MKTNIISKSWNNWLDGRFSPLGQKLVDWYAKKHAGFLFFVVSKMAARRKPRSIGHKLIWNLPKSLELSYAVSNKESLESLELLTPNGYKTLYQIDRNKDMVTLLGSVKDQTGIYIKMKQKDLPRSVKRILETGHSIMDQKQREAERWQTPAYMIRFIERLVSHIFSPSLETEPEIQTKEDDIKRLVWKLPTGKLIYELHINGKESVVFHFCEDFPVGLPYAIIGRLYDINLGYSTMYMEYYTHPGYKGKTYLSMPRSVGETMEPTYYTEEGLPPLIKEVREKAHCLLTEKFPQGIFYDSLFIKRHHRLDPSP